MGRLLLTLAVVLVPCLDARADNIQLGLRLPEGFQISQFADSNLANDIYCMTIDPKGRVVVSGRGYIRILLDVDKNGVADRAVDFADSPKDGAMGLYWEKDALFVTGDGGLRVFHDKDGDDRADGPSTLIRSMRTGSEHAAHAIRRGPDGWLYVLCGNNTNIDRTYAELSTSPVQDPVAGCVLRFTPDLRKSEIVAHGFRNPYDMDFNCDGELFMYDSDNERCVSLPWYEGTRFYHVVPGGHHGWLSPHRADTFRLPPYLIDVVNPVADLGRGSPTAAICYRHAQFPQEYRGAFLLADWTFGRIYAIKPASEPRTTTGTPYQGKAKTFLETIGDNGFAPTALAVHPDSGDLFVAVGGRGTRGAVYRVRYPKGLTANLARDAAALQPMPRSLEWDESRRKKVLLDAASESNLQRLQALHDLLRHRKQFEAKEIAPIVQDNWDSSSRYTRLAAAELMETLGDREQQQLIKLASSELARSTAALAVYQKLPVAVITRATEFLRRTGDATDEQRLTWLRVIELALGDFTHRKARGTVWEGYTAAAEIEEVFKTAPELRTSCIAAIQMNDFRSGLAHREALRVLAMLRAEHTVWGNFVEDMAEPRDPIEALHGLIVFACLEGKRTSTQTTAVANALVQLDENMIRQGRKRDSNWPLRVAELYTELARKDPALHRAALDHVSFGRPSHALFARAAGFDQQRAARVFLARAGKDADFTWNNDVVHVIGALPPDDALPVLRELWGKAGLESAILPILARHPQPENLAKFIDGLASTNFQTVELCLNALTELPHPVEAAESFALIRTLGALPEKEKVLRTAVARRLEQVTAQKFGLDSRAWSEWIRKRHPELAAKLHNPDGVDTAAWQNRLTKIDWQKGTGDAGKQVFVRAQCAACHSSGQAVGPDLAGVGKRFSQDDMLTAILQPSRDVSPQFQTTLVELSDGRVLQGRIVYQAVDGIIMQTGPVETIRLSADQVAAMRNSRASLMPAGLLDRLTDRDIADLVAYLKAQ